MPGHDKSELPVTIIGIRSREFHAYRGRVVGQPGLGFARTDFREMTQLQTLSGKTGPAKQFLLNAWFPVTPLKRTLREWFSQAQIDCCRCCPAQIRPQEPI